MKVQLGEQVFEASPKVFSTGNTGYGLYTKLETIENVPDAVAGDKSVKHRRYQVSLNIIEIKPKN